MKEIYFFGAAGFAHGGSARSDFGFHEMRSFGRALPLFAILCYATYIHIPDSRMASFGNTPTPWSTQKTKQKNTKKVSTVSGLPQKATQETMDTKNLFGLVRYSYGFTPRLKLFNRLGLSCDQDLVSTGLFGSIHLIISYTDDLINEVLRDDPVAWQAASVHPATHGDCQSRA